MFTVYALISIKDNRTYIGYTNNFPRRFKEHNNGQVKSTRNRKPFKVLFIEDFICKQEAKHKELWWKSSSGRRQLKKQFKRLKEI